MEIAQFKKKLGKGVTLVEFSATWCAPCKAQKPIIKELARRYQERALIIEMDIDKHNALAKQCMVQSIPTLIIFKNGIEIQRLVGLQSRATVAKNLDKAL